jgi:hypothetical protein
MHQISVKCSASLDSPQAGMTPVDHRRILGRRKTNLAYRLIDAGGQATGPGLDSGRRYRRTGFHFARTCVVVGHACSDRVTGAGIRRHAAPRPANQRIQTRIRRNRSE